MNYLEFEKPLAEIEGKAEELRAMARSARSRSSVRLTGPLFIECSGFSNWSR